MTTELLALSASAVLCALLFAPYGIAQTRVWGIRAAVGNRENPPGLPEWANRAIRAHRNMVENLPHFSALVLVAQLLGVSTAETSVGATTFFLARLVHAAVYIAGIPWARTAAFFLGLAGEAMIVLAIARAHLNV